MKRLTLLALICINLSGCIFVVGATAGAAIVAAVYDHRKIEKIVDDQKINNSVVSIINTIPGLHENAHINVTTFNHIVLLTGQVKAVNYREQAEEIARTVPGVEKVYNQIAVKGPSSALTRASDSWITAKVKTEMLATKDLESGTIKVLTENGTVYLMGIVNQEQAETAVEIARSVTGVQKVIKIFQYST